MQISKSKIMPVLKWIAIVSFVFLIGGIGGIIIDTYVIPSMSSNKLLSRTNFFKQATKNVTVINNSTEKITIREDDSINEVSSKASNAVVDIISIAAKSSDLKSKNASGVIVTSDGMIATYRDAIMENNAQYKVFLFNGNVYDAKFVGTDNFTNLAYLKIDATNLTTVSFANSDDIKPGKKIIAIGNANGEYENRFAAGLISSVNKNFNIAGKALASTDKLEGVFESDIKNESGYVGGPVINYNGELVGIIGSVKIDSVDRYFEIPSNVVKASVDKAIRNELENGVVFGAYYISLTKEYAIVNNVSSDKGALIYSPSGKQNLALLANSVAEKNGIRINDIIVSVNDQEININNPLSNALSRFKKGDTVQFKIIRNGQETNQQIQL